MSSQNSKILMTALVVVLVVSTFFVGALWTKVRYLEQHGNPTESDNTKAPSAAKPTTPKTAGPVPKPSETDHINGNKDAKFVLIEYSDFDCPFCGTFHETAQQTLDTYGNDIMWIYRHFPLDSMHPNARKKAEASECIAKLAGNEAFWAFAEALFKEKPTVEDLSVLAVNVGADKAAFESCLSSEEYKQKVENQRLAGVTAGVTGTPGNFLMNLETGETVPLAGAQPFSVVKSTLDNLMKE